VQYADYAIWQQGWLKGELLVEQLSYWERQLGANPPALNLPTDKPRPIVQTFRGATESFFIEKELSESVKTLSRDEGVTLFMTLLSVFKMLLYQYTGQEEIVVGIPIAGRHRIETEGLIGCFVNTLVVKSRLSSDLTVRELLMQVREVALEGYAHQDLPFERLVEEMRPERDLSRHPLFQVMFVLQNAPRQELELPGLTLKPISVETKAAKFDLTLFVRESKQGLTGILEYNVDLFEAATIRRWIKHFQNILRNAVANPHKPISELGALTDDELQQIVIDWNETQANYPKEKCLHQLFEEQVKRTGGRVAVMHGSQKQTYDELNRRSNQLAHYLKRSGVGPEVIVGIHMDRSIEMLVSILGVLKAGGAYLPLETGSPKDRLALMIEDGRASLILTRGRSQASLPDRVGKIIDWDEQWESISEESEANLANEASPHNLAYVLYTSGSTGQPKGVMIQHQGLINYLSWCVAAYSVAEGEGAPVHSPIGFDLTVTSLFSPLLAGKTTVLSSDRDGVEWLSSILQSGENYSLIKLTPAHLNLLSQGLPDSRAAARVNALIVGGEALRAESLEFWRACAPTTRIINEYGPTETVVGCCVYEIKNGEAITGAVPIGRPIANTQIRILDDNMRPVPIGRIGHLYIGGDGVARGYANQPKLTAEKFVPDPYAKVPGARLYKSGDHARYLPDGAIEFIGRDDDQVKIRGYRLELGEIESVIGAHPDVGQVSVIVREDTPGDKRLVAYLAGSVGDTMNINRLRDYLKQKLPEYMLPSNFVVLNSLPLTSTGKVDRRRLPMPSEHRPDLDVSYLGPRTEVEQSIANIWRQVLRIDEPGVNDNFFDLGGNSLLLAQARAKLVEVFGECVSLVDMFLYPTVSSLSSYLTRSLDEREPLKPDFARSEKRSAAVEEQRELRRRHRSLSRF
jgi:amino acid adenylation domain-containing protein